LGSWAIGALASSVGTPLALLLSGGLLAGAAMLGLLWPLRRLDVDLEARTDWSIPQTIVPVDGTSGPIGLAVQHRVAEADVPEFLWIMEERSRILRRDGAKRWSIARDLGDAELWIERYQFPTWLDYVRLQARRTKADLDNQTRLDRIRMDGRVIQRTLERPLARDHHAYSSEPRAMSETEPPSP